MKAWWSIVACGLFMCQSAKAMNVGDEVPDVSVPSTSGQPVNLRSVPGWKVVYFYPKSFTPGCTKQACGMRDAKSVYDALGVTVFGVSTDDLDTQIKFKKEHGLTFDLLADEKKELTKAFNVDGMLGMAKRETFIISPEGKVTDIVASVSVGTHDQDIAELIRKRQSPD